MACLARRIRPSASRKAKGAVAQRAGEDRSCIGANGDVGANPRDIVLLRHRRRVGIPNGRTRRAAVGCPRADGPNGGKAKGAVAQRAAAISFGDGAVRLISHKY